MRPSMLLLAIPFALSMSLSGSSGVAPANLSPPTEQTSARSVSVGYWHHCVITDEGRARCWGDGHWGELGTGTRESWNRPAAVVGPGSSFTQVIAVDRASCAIDEQRAVWCWGGNYAGQLGIGSKVNKRVRPVAVTGLDRPVTALSGLDAHMCVVQSNGAVACWGDNGEGQVGPAAGGWRARSPVPVELAGRATSVSAGGDMSCAVLEDHGLWCWGGRQGKEPSLVRDDVQQVSVGTSHACLVTRTGSAECWGANYFGSLGDGTTDNRRTPVQVSGLDHGVVRVEAGNGISCALLDDDTVRCWGMTGLGEGGSPRYLTPAPVIGLGPVAYLDVGLSDACAVTDLGETRCWGVDQGPIIARTQPGLEGSSRVVRQPDLQLTKAATRNLRGDGVYNESGLDQTLAIGALPGKTATILVRVENDGGETDLFFVDAHAPRHSMATTQYVVDGRNVTDQIRYGQFHRMLAPGDSFDIVVNMRLDPDVWSRARLPVQVTARSAHNQAAVDRVLAIANVRHSS